MIAPTSQDIMQKEGAEAGKVHPCPVAGAQERQQQRLDSGWGALTSRHQARRRGGAREMW